MFSTLLMGHVVDAGHLNAMTFAHDDAQAGPLNIEGLCHAVPCRLARVFCR